MITIDALYFPAPEEVVNPIRAEKVSQVIWIAYDTTESPLTRETGIGACELAARDDLDRQNSRRKQPALIPSST